ncbi:BTAD domain-containing putative transcriptional regulator [Dactylosporangium sp. CA-139066]|uniref:BTAD domain-containing putative transcriptional regulator n=1 Tax=Dactylosporangium sp. CA-139066 TaxID=3239930 RepID=UPI003D927264
MRITTLGELAVDGHPVRGERLAAVVRALVDARGRTLTPGALAEAVWGGAEPADAAGAVHALIGRARRLGLPVAAAPGGYRVPPEDIELDTVLAKAHLAAGAPQLARALFPAAPDLTDPSAATLFAEVAAATGDEADLRLLAGRTPPHEPSAALLIRVLAAQGRDAEALEVVEGLRATLADTYGTDPSPVVAEAHLAVLRGEVAEQQTPPRAKSTLPASWRRAATPMLGREADVAAVRKALAEAPLVTVVAVGGAGKTRLAGEIARRAAAEGTPVHVVELAGLREPGEVLAAILAVADPSSRPTAQRLQELAGLVVLDNCEHVLSGAAGAAAELLAAAPDASVLATSRAPLGLAGEVVHRLHTLGDEAAVELLTARARAGGAELGAGDLAAAPRLCRRLDNLPLALELAAARLRHMPIEDVLAGLDDRFGLLDDALRGLPERHASLWAMVDWSRELLRPEQQRLLERLAVIPAPFTAEAAEAVSGLPRRGLAVHLAALVEQSLLGRAEGGDGRARYRMLETVREYGEARLAASGERDAALDGLVAWARQEATRILAELIGPGQLAAFTRCAAESDNFVAALRRAVGRDDAAAVDVAVPLFLLWTVRGLHAEVLPWSSALLGAGDPARRRAAGIVEAADPDRLAWICVLSGLNAFATDTYRMFAVSTRLLRTLTARRGRELSARPRALSGVLPALVAYDLDKGLAAAERLVADPDPYVQGFGLFLRAGIRENRGDAVSPQERMADAELAYRRFEEAGDHWGMGMSAQSIGSQGAAGSAEWLRRGAAHMELLGAAEDAGTIRILLDVQLAQAGDDDAAGRLRAVVDAPAPATPPQGLQVMDAAQAHLGLAQHAWYHGRPAETVEHGERAATIAAASPASVPQIRVVFAIAAAVLHLRANGAQDAPRAAELLAGARDEAIAGIDVPAMGSWAQGVAALAAHAGDEAASRELWALGERCAASTWQLFEHGADPTLEAALGPPGDRTAAWRERPMTEVTDRIRELSGEVFQTLRR